MRPSPALAALALVAASSWAGAARAQPPGAGAAASKDGDAAVASLRDRLGVDDAARLLRSNDPDERLRGVEQAAGLHTVEALGLLGRAAGTDASRGLDPRLPAEGIARTDPRAVLAVVRGLASWTDREDARAALAALVSAPGESFTFRVGTLPGHEGNRGDVEDPARIQLARREAAVALAGSGSSLAIEALVAIARGSGPGREAALDALAVHPPSAPLPLGGVALTTPAMIALAADIGDLRSLDPVLGALRASDPALRAAVFEALGASADTRVADAARATLHEEPTDGNAAVRLAAARALVRLGARDGAEAVAALVDSDATAAGALVLARDVQGDDVTRAAAARASSEGDAALRPAAIVALGRQASPAAVHALAELLADPRLGGDALGALARSPSSAAMAAIEAMDDASAGEGASARRRLAGRAYFVRRFTRRERSPRLDARLDALASSADSRDRAVGVEALVALGERRLQAAIEDPDPHVRAAAALGAMALDAARRDDVLLDRMAIEPDADVRKLLAFGWAAGRVDRGSPSTTALVELATGGGIDAALAARALGRRTGDRARLALDALLASTDPVMRAQAAKGIGDSTAPDASERLARAYAWEAAASVRRAVVEALAARTGDHSAARARTLTLAARLDPDRWARWAAQQGLQGKSPPEGAAPREVLWIHLVPAEGAAPPAEAQEGVFVGSDGVAAPVLFDAEGFALVPGVAPGEGRLRLAPGDQPYSARAP